MSTCMYCGAQLAPNAAGCGKCGRPVAAAPQMPYGQQQQAPMGYAQPPQGYAQPPGGQLPYGGAPQQPYPPQQGYGYPPNVPMGYGNTQPPAAPPATEWKWGYSRWVGIHYGPIPVGIIIALIILAAWGSSR